MSDADELKKRFKQGAVPDESDYASLITLANPVTGSGLEVASGRLNVKAGDGISAGEGGVSVNVDRTTLDVTGGVLGVKLQAGGNSGLDSAGGLHVKTGAGLKADAAGLGVDLAENSGLAHDKQVEGRWPLYVNVDEKTSGLEFDATTHKLQVKVPKNEKNYLTMGPEGVSLTAEGITKMKAELETVTSAALDNATKNTATGKSPDTTVAKETMEGRIAKALNEAYQEGYGSIVNNRPNVRKALLRYPVDGHSYSIDLAKDSEVSTKTGDLLIYAPGMPTSNDKWVNTISSLSPEGALKLTGNSGTNYSPIVVYAATTSDAVIVGSQIWVLGFDPKISFKGNTTAMFKSGGVDINLVDLLSIGETLELKSVEFKLSSKETLSNFKIDNHGILRVTGTPDQVNLTCSVQFNLGQPVVKEYTLTIIWCNLGLIIDNKDSIVKGVSLKGDKLVFSVALSLLSGSGTWTSANHIYWIDTAGISVAMNTKANRISGTCTCQVKARVDWYEIVSVNRIREDHQTPIDGVLTIPLDGTSASFTAVVPDAVYQGEGHKFTLTEFKSSTGTLTDVDGDKWEVEVNAV